MPSDILQRKDASNIAALTLNSPKTANALSDQMLARMSAELDDIAKDPKIRAVILRAKGKAFSAGHDLKEMQAVRRDGDGGASAHKALFDRCSALMLQIEAMPQPVIAEVQGIATAAGCQLVATCDMALAASDAKFGVNGVNIGLFCSTPMVALTRAIPPKRAFEMLTTGEFISAKEALELGLVNRVVAPESLGHETRKLAKKVASKLPMAIQIGKSAFYAQRGLDTRDAYAQMGRVMVDNLAEADTDEGMNAFVEKRKPKWG